MQAISLHSRRRNCNYTFANLIGWQFWFNSELWLAGDAVVLRFSPVTLRRAYMVCTAGVPSGRLIDMLLSDSGGRLTILGLEDDQAVALRDSRTDLNVAIEPRRDSYDYIYLRATGSGYDYCPTPTMEESRSMPRSFGRRIFYWMSGIAAVFVVGIFLIQNLFVANSPNEYMPSPRMNDMTLRAGSDNSEIELLLSQKKYEDALDLIEEEYLAVKEDSLAIVQDETMDAERKEYDMQIVKDKQDELNWLKAHALLGLSQQETALRILDELRNEEGYYQMAADSLYNHIKK